MKISLILLPSIVILALALSLSVSASRDPRELERDYYDYDYDYSSSGYTDSSVEAIPGSNIVGTLLLVSIFGAIFLIPTILVYLFKERHTETNEGKRQYLWIIGVETAIVGIPILVWLFWFLANR